MVRGLDTTVRKLRRQVFEEVARLGFRANEENFEETLNDEVEAIPYRMVMMRRDTGRACTAPARS